MKAKVLIAVVATTLLWGPTTFQAQTPAPKLTVSPDSINFGAHDIGTATSVVAATTLTVSNGRNAAVSLSVSSSGPNTKDFSTSSTCGGTVAAKGQCQITVVFNPVMIANNACAERSATLEFKADTDVVRVQLTGRAYQNLGVSPSIVELPIQRWSSTAAPAAVLLTNYTDAQLESVTVTVNGNFTEDHAGCVKIDPGKSCSIFVTYPPRQSGDAKGVLALTGTIAPAVATTENSGKTEAACPAAPFRRLTTGVVLNGRSYSGWRWWRFDVHSWFLLAISAAFFFSLVLGRWHMIAKPTRAEIIAEVRALRARINADKLSHDSEEKQSRLRQINRLLDAALYPFEYPHFYDPTGTGTGTSIGAKDAGPVSDSLPSTWQRLRHAWFSVPTPTPQFPRWWTRVFDALFWTRGADFASWRLIHEAEREYASLLPLQSVQARLEVAEQELRNMNAPVTVALADRIHQSLSFGDVELLEQEKELIQQLQSQLKPLSVPEAARLAWLVVLEKKAAETLQALANWISANPVADADSAKCQDQLKSFLVAVDGSQDLKNDAKALADLLDDSDPSKKRPLEIYAVFGHLATVAESLAAVAKDSTRAIDGFNKLLGGLKGLEAERADLSSKLGQPLTDPTKTDQKLLELCKARVALVAAVKRVTGQGGAIGQLKDILAELQAENDLVDKVSQCKDASEIASHMPELKALAVSQALSAALIDRVRSELETRLADPLHRWRALLTEALVLIDDDADSAFSNVTGWHNKLMWLVVCALIFLVGVGLAFGNGVILLAGGVGGLLSRLQRTLDTADVPNDYGATWGALFLSPLTGALTAWGGTLLVILGVKLNLLGANLRVEWDNPWDTTALAVAVILGFQERWFSGILNAIEPKVTPPAPAAPASTASPAPTITSTNPSTAKSGQPNTLKVVGTNFQSGATASFTDRDNKLISAAVDANHSATSMNITFTLTGTTAYRATLTVTNPDKQFATYSVEVTA